MRKIYMILVIALVFRVILSFLTWHPDLNNHIDWGIRFWQYGAAKFYAPETNVWSFTWPNQPPGTIYIFAGIRKVFEFLFNLFSIAHFQAHVFPGSWLLFLEKTLYPALLKLPSIVSDIGIGFLIYKIILLIEPKSIKKAFTGALIWLVNPIIWYNSSIWGQTDAVINFFALASFFYLFKKRFVPAVFLLLLSFYIKLSLTIFLPIFIIIAIRQKYKIREWLKSFIIPVIFFGLLTIPFSKGEPFSWLINLYQNKVLGQQLQIITANAFNIWAAISGIAERPQTLPFLGLTYQLWGLILFTLSYIPILLSVYKKQDPKFVIWSLAIAAFSAFMLLTNMHERYLYPLFPYFTIMVALNFELFANYIAVSIISLLNLYNFWWFPFIPNLVSVMSQNDRLAPRVLGALNFLMFAFLYIRFLRLSPLKKLYSKE